MDAVSIILQFFFNRQRAVLMGLTLLFRPALRTKRSGGTNQYPPDCLLSDRHSREISVCQPQLS
jgi:hypothetical protein